MRNRIQWAERFPVFADYTTFARQPEWWIRTLDNYYSAENTYNEQKNG